MSTSLHRLDRIGSLDPVRWDQLAGNNPLLGHGWLWTNEDALSGAVEQLYLVVEEDRRPVAACACYLDDPGRPFESVDDLLFGRLASAGAPRLFTLRPALVCGFPWSTGSGCLIDPEATESQRARWTERLVAEISGVASRRGYSVVFPSVNQQERTLIDCLGAAGYAGARHEPIFAIDIDWPDFEAYRCSLPSKNIRKNIRREMNKNRRLGIEIEELSDPRPEQAVLHRIVDRHFRGYGWPAFPYGSGWFAALKSRLGDNAVVCVARQQGGVIGVSVSVRKQGVRQMLLGCVDHGAAENTLAHFNLAYYWPIADCIRTGDRRYVVGPGQHLSRTRRAYRPLASHIYCRPHGRVRGLAVRGWMPLLSAWMRRKSSRPGRQSTRLEGSSSRTSSAAIPLRCA